MTKKNYLSKIKEKNSMKIIIKQSNLTTYFRKDKILYGTFENKPI
jgi:hypothetical protein